MKITTLWVVTRPTDLSVLDDICFQTDLIGLGLQFLGGLKTTEVVAAFTEREEAQSLARKLLAIHADIVALSVQKTEAECRAADEEGRS